MKYFNTYKYLLGGTVVLISGCATEKEKKVNEGVELGYQPNILWISCEDITPSLGCYGDTVARTPNLDKLANEGIRFTRAYSVSGVSAPSRCALITGMYPTSIGGHHMRTTKCLLDSIPSYSIVPPPQVKCFTEYLRSEGYFCTNNNKTDYQFKVPLTAWDECGVTAHWKHRKKGQPFFSVFNLTITHESRQWENGWFKLLVLPEEVNVPPYYPDHPRVRRDIARKYSNISLMDGEVGILLQQLEDQGLLDSTIVVFFSDHGGPLPRQKRELYESGLRVPLIIRFPDKRFAGSMNEQLVSFVDFGPTMLSLAGIEPPDYVQGKAFMGTFEKSPRKYIYAGRDRMDTKYDMVRAVRDIRFKYLKNYRPELPFVQNIRYRKKVPMMNVLYRYDSLNKFEGAEKLWWRDNKPKEELYDVANDPYELNNLADDSSYKDKLLELRNALHEWQDKYGDKGFIPEKKMISQMWNGDEQPATKDVVFTEKDGKVIITCSTEGASIAYKLVEKGKQKEHWQLYTKPIDKKDIGDKELYATAIRIGYKQSDIEVY